MEDYRVVTVVIYGANCHRRINEVSAFVGSNRLYLKGSDQAYYLDARDRAEADMLVHNLNLMSPEVHARILGDPPKENART